MKKRVSELSQEEFRKTFPIELHGYNDSYAAWYEEEKERILSVVNRDHIVRINHIGSSAIPNIVAKPIVDILLEIDGTCNVAQLLEDLKKIDFGTELVQKKDDPFSILVTKGMTVDGFAEKTFILHLRYAGDWNELYFRDYLLKYPDIAQKYGDLKAQILQDIKDGKIERMPNGKPNGYSQAKFAFVDDISRKAKAEFANRYGSHV